jgi:hypothetical protein
VWVEKIHEFSLLIAHSIASAEKTMRSRGFANRVLRSKKGI